VVRIDHPLLALRGQHRIEVRARYTDEWRSLDPQPVAFDVEIRRAKR
jgi:hypothetical protein